MSHTLKSISMIGTLFLLLGLAACGSPAPTSTPTLDLNPFRTEVAATVLAHVTQTLAQVPSDTPIPSSTPTPEPTSTPAQVSSPAVTAIGCGRHHLRAGRVIHDVLDHQKCGHLNLDHELRAALFQRQ